VTTPSRIGDIETTRIPTDQLEQYFDRFTRHFLLSESTNRVDLEVLSSDWGDQFEAEGAQLLGITYDPKDNALDFELEGGDHRVQHLTEVWTAEETDGFVKAIEVVRDDGTKEVARVNRLGVAPASSAGGATSGRRQKNSGTDQRRRR
jgi:hypothetical protein